MFDSISFSFHKLFPEKLLLITCIFFATDTWDSSTMEQAGSPTKEKLFHGLSVTSGQEIAQLHLRKKNQHSLVESSAGNSGRVEAVISTYYFFVSVCQQRIIENKVNWNNLGSFDPMELFFLDLIEKRDVLHHRQ